MKSHELARLLLTLPDLPIATHANNHTFMSCGSHGRPADVRVGVLSLGGDREHIVVGNFHSCDINAPNWYVSELLFGAADPMPEAKMTWLRSNGWTKDTKGTKRGT